MSPRPDCGLRAGLGLPALALPGDPWAMTRWPLTVGRVGLSPGWLVAGAPESFARRPPRDRPLRRAGQLVIFFPIPYLSNSLPKSNLRKQAIDQSRKTVTQRQWHAQADSAALVPCGTAAFVATAALAHGGELVTAHGGGAATARGDGGGCLMAPALLLPPTATPTRHATAAPVDGGCSVGGGGGGGGGAGAGRGGGGCGPGGGSLSRVFVGE